MSLKPPSLPRARLSWGCENRGPLVRQTRF